MKILDTYNAFAKQLFLEAEVDDDKMIKYKKKDGEQGEMKASSAKKLPKDHPAKIEYDKMVGGDDKGEKPKGKALGGSDFDRDAQNKKDADAWADKMFGGHGPSRPSDVDPEKPADEPSDMDTERPADEPEDEVPGKNAPEPIKDDEDTKRMGASIQKKIGGSKDPDRLELQGKQKASNGETIIQWKDTDDGSMVGVDAQGNIYEDGEKQNYGVDVSTQSDVFGADQNQQLLYKQKKSKDDSDSQNQKDADAWADKMFGHAKDKVMGKDGGDKVDWGDDPDRGTDDYGQDDLVVPDNEGDWADEMDAVSGEYEEYKGYMEDSKRELEQARAGGDEEEIEDALERFKDDEAEFIKQRDHRNAMIQKAGDEGWLDDYGDEDLEKEYQFQQKLKNRSGKGGGMIGSIGAREKGQGGSGMYDTEKDAYGHSKGDPRYYDPYADAKRRKRAMNASKDYKIINGKKYRPVNEAQNKIADIRKILKTNKGKRIDSIFMDVETAKKVIKHYKSLKGSAKEKFVKQKIQNIVKSVNESKKEEKDFTQLLKENYKRFSRK